MFYRVLTIAAAGFALAACTPEYTPAEEFFDRVSEHCGKAYEGKLVSTDEVDAGFAAERIVMHVRECSDTEIRIPLHVGDNRSRTWIVTKTETGLRLKHDHRHEDGHADEVTMYGGDSADTSEGAAFAFPVDEYSKVMFDDTGIPDSKQNTWVMESNNEDDVFAYQMSRPNRFFRLEFDTSKPVDAPPAAWGHE